ncbi:MAG: peptide chain release factor N(5)-glutamine methyltransferase [Bacteroidales bacterium]|nr:peptide chain release factor N(5)-glutamine methyltransferase [Bacteroidales bacterium]
MKNEILFKELLSLLERHLRLLSDKPEETYESTLAALWLLAAGEAISAEEAVTKELPELKKVEEDKLRKLVEKRIAGIPLAHITGRQQFMGVELMTDAKALIPRKETEILGKTAQEILENIVADGRDEIMALDLCCGAGNLAIALALHVPEVRFMASDLSREAVELTKENIRFHHLENRIVVLQGSVFEAFEGKGYDENVDVIICNPPYISDTKVSRMAKEIAEHEPELAFKGGTLGLSIITELIRKAPLFLKKDGWLTFEVGLGQGAFVKQLVEKTTLYEEVSTVADQQGNIRVITARK